MSKFSEASTISQISQILGLVVVMMTIFGTAFVALADQRINEKYATDEDLRAVQETVEAQVTRIEETVTTNTTTVRATADSVDALVLSVLGLQISDLEEEIVELEREKRQDTKVHFLRLEQLYPFPHDALAELMEPYKHCHLVWCQEEPRNMGAWPFASTFIEEVAEGIGFDKPRPRYAGRSSAASPATGSHKRHVAEQAALVDDALTLGKKRVGRIESRKAESEARERSGGKGQAAE